MAKKEEKNPVGRPKLADSELIKGSVSKTITYKKVIPASKVKVIPAEHAETKKINSDGTVTRVIPAIKTKTISVSK